MRINPWLLTAILLLLILLNSLLLASPNLLGKIGLIVYRYSYLRTFLRTLLTVSLLSGMAILSAGLVYFLVIMQWIRKRAGTFILWIFILLCVILEIKVIIAFSGWTYGHTGLRFRLGVYFLPLLMMYIFINGLWFVNKFKFTLLHHATDGQDMPEERSNG